MIKENFVTQKFSAKKSKFLSLIIAGLVGTFAFYIGQIFSTTAYPSNNVRNSAPITKTITFHSLVLTISYAVCVPLLLWWSME